MSRLLAALEALRALVEMGGTVVVILLAMSVVAGGVTLFKIWQFRVLGVGRHAAVTRALESWEAGAAARALATARAGGPGLAVLADRAMRAAPEDRPGLRERLHAEAEARMARIESGFRLLDTVAQLGPLLGLFGTVIGMIAAFRGMEGAGSSVDPSVLAQGIWVALLTTAVGLAVAIAATAVLTLLESRAAAERVMADTLIETLCGPALPAPGSGSGLADRMAAHA